MVTAVRNPWTVAADPVPAIDTLADVFRWAVSYAVLAPSGHNTQPWRFRFDDDAIELHADRTRALPVIDPDDREMTISCGTALLHLRLALEHAGGVEEDGPLGVARHRPAQSFTVCRPEAPPGGEDV